MLHYIKVATFFHLWVKSNLVKRVTSRTDILNPSVNVLLYRYLIIFLKLGQSRPLNSFIFSSFQTLITNFTTKKCENMSIQYMVPGFKLMTYGT